MSDQEDKVSKHVDALEALAAGGNVSPPGGEGQVEPSSGLMLLSEEDEEAPASDDALASMAAAVEADEADSPADEADSPTDEADSPTDEADSPTVEADSPTDEADSPADEALQSIAEFTSAALPVQRQQRSARFDSHMRRATSHQYKRTMIPLLIVVGVLLLIFGVVTLLMVLRGDGGDEYTGEATYLKVYGKLFVLVSLPFGAILLLGAWLFHLDTRKPGPRSPSR